MEPVELLLFQNLSIPEDEEDEQFVLKSIEKRKFVSPIQVRIRPASYAAEL
eukprot:SAG31_NODE_598_length_13651_cov_10.681818_11_plen_51_part_00